MDTPSTFMHQLHILNANGHLTSYEALITDVIETTFLKIGHVAPLHAIDIVIQHSPDEVIPETGEGGYAFDSTSIFLQIDLNRPNIEQIITRELPRTLAHEYHHTLRTASYGPNKCLKDALVSEGLADHFDVEIHQSRPRPWCTQFSEKDCEKWLKKALKDNEESPFDYGGWFLDQNPTIPRWTGYSLGFYLIGLYYKKNPDKKASQLFSEPTNTFFE